HHEISSGDWRDACPGSAHVRDVVRLGALAGDGVVAAAFLSSSVLAIAKVEHGAIAMHLHHLLPIGAKVASGMGAASSKGESGENKKSKFHGSVPLGGKARSISRSDAPSGS